VLKRGAAGGLASAEPRWELHQTRMQSIGAANEGAEIGALGGCEGIRRRFLAQPGAVRCPSETEITEVNRKNLTRTDRSHCT